MSWFDGLLWPIMLVVAWIMVQFHKLFTAMGLDSGSGAGWTLSIIGLVIVMRILLIPLFFKQIKASRGMQMLAPEMQAIQKKYKGKTDPASREAMSRETMELYKKHGTNPFASCLPILLQSPDLLRAVPCAELPAARSPTGRSRGATSASSRRISPSSSSRPRSSVHRCPGTFMKASEFSDPSTAMHIRIVTIVLILAMTATTFTTQRQLTMKNMPPSALEGPMAQQQKMLLYVLPLVFAFSGVNFPIGVLVYWTTTNIWSMGQQFYTIRRMPAPGSQAEAALKARQAHRAAAKGQTIEDAPRAVIEEAPRSGQREQPKRKDRAKPRPVSGAPSDEKAPLAEKPTTSTKSTAPKKPTAPKQPKDDDPGSTTSPTPSPKPKK